MFKNILGFEPFSLCDWPGKASSVIYLGGCNFKCPTCHNWKIATQDSELKEISFNTIVDYLTRYKHLIGGVVITGGEPTIYKDLIPLVSELKKILPVKLDTNGSDPLKLGTLLRFKLVDLIAVDIKGPMSLYPSLTGNSILPEQMIVNLLDILLLASNFKNKFYFRTTLVPTLTEEDKKVVAEYVAPDFKINFQPYRIPIRS